MTKSKPSGRFRKLTCVPTLLFGMIFILFVACCGQTADNIDPQPNQTQPHPEAEGAQQSTVTQPRGQQSLYAPDEVLVKFEPETDAKIIVDILAEMKLETMHQFASPNLFLIKITDGATVEATIKRLSEYDAVKYAEPNYEVKTTP
ncbi:MAG: hypothetical protein R3274_01635 [Desulfobacterales bacterium]|nr:hypothetical protein [Desulfobacterales bacterium]